MYTKGEWSLQSIPHQHDFRKGNAYCVRDERNCCLAVVGEVDAIFDGEETKANASLIASAPELLEALKALRTLMKDDSKFRMQIHCIGDEFEAYHIFEICDNALSKAEGNNGIH